MATFTITTNEKTNTPPYQTGKFYVELNSGDDHVFTEYNLTSETVPEYMDAEGDLALKIKIVDGYTDIADNKGKLFLNNVELGIGDEVLMTEIANGNFKYVSDISFDGVYEDNFYFDIADIGSGEYGDLIGEISINLGQVVNLPPTIGNGEETISHQENLIFTRRMFTLDTVPPYSDPENDSAALLKITSLPTNGRLLLDGEPVQLNQIISFEDIDDGLFTFLNLTFSVSTTIDNFTFGIADTGSGVFVY